MALYTWSSCQNPKYQGTPLGTEWSTKHEDHPIPKYHERSRGRHSPGSGDYWNIWVTGGSVEIVDQNGKAGVLSFDEEWETTTVGGYWKPGAIHREAWDGLRYIIASIGIIDIAGQLGGRWTVEYAMWLGKPTGRRSGPWKVGNETKYQLYFPLYAMDDKLNSTRVQWADRSEASHRAALEYYSNIWNRMSSWQPNPKSKLLRTDWPWEALHCWVRPITPIPSHESKQYALRISEGDETFSQINYAVNDAYIEAVNGFPSLAGMNNIANIIDILKLLLDFFKAIFLGEGISLADDVGSLLKDAWLAYRYEYSTTRADLQEGIEYMERIIDLTKVTSLRSNSVIHQGDWTVKCSIKATTDSLDALRSKMAKWGLELNSYAAWDLVPFSFVVDWFLDVGGWLEWGQKKKAAFRCSPSSVWYSVEHRFVNEYGFNETYYHRFLWATSPSLSSYRTNDGVSRRTVVKRALDLLALFG